jgi:PAS domain S-box-containing protein
MAVRLTRGRPEVDIGPARPRRTRSAPIARILEPPTTEALFRSMLADADAGIVLVDRDRRIAEINPAAQRLLGVTAARARGRPASEVIRGVVPGDDLLADALRRTRLERETVLLTGRGGEVPVGVRSHRLGRPPSLLLTLRDLTQLRRMHEELRRNERLALLGQLSAGVAHEIRNPLAGIGTSAQVLLRRFEPRDERAQFVRVILEEVSRLDRIATSLLQYSRPRTPELSQVSLAPLVEHVLDLSAEPRTASDIRTEIDVQPRLPSVFVDPSLVTQVLLNVTLNAVQAMPSGGTLRLEIRRVRRREPPRGVGRRASDRGDARPSRAVAPWREFQQVRIADTGVGMSRGVLAKLFHPFFTTKPRGTGLGLAICQTIMQEHRGSIEIASREGRGTTVMLNFPVEKRHGERREPDAHAVRAHTPHR